MENLPHKDLTVTEFRALCGLLVDEQGRALDQLTRTFKALVSHRQKWKAWLHSEPEWAGHPLILRLLEEAQREHVERALKNLVDSGRSRSALEEGHWLLSSFADPFIRREDISGPLDQMATELNLLLADASDEEEAVNAFRHYIFDKHGFHGNSRDYYNPDNSFLHKVIARRVGIPISLTSICLLLARRAQWRGRPLPLSGVGLPSHFIAQFRFPTMEILLDPFNRGRILTRKDCAEILRSHKMDFQETYLIPVDDHAILTRAMANLFHVYANMGEDKERDQLLRYLEILNGDGVPDQSPFVY